MIERFGQHAARLAEHQQPFARFVLHPHPRERLGNDIGHAAEKVHIVAREAPAPASVGPENAVGAVLTRGRANDRAHAADHAVLDQQWRGAEARLGAQIVDNDRLVRQQRVTAWRIGTDALRGRADAAFGPSDAGAEKKRPPAGTKLEHLRHLGVERLRHNAHRIVEQLLGFAVAERTPAQIRDRRLLTRVRPRLVAERVLDDNRGRAAAERPEQPFVLLGKIGRAHGAHVHDTDHPAAVHERNAVEGQNSPLPNGGDLHLRGGRRRVQEHRLLRGRDAPGKTLANRNAPFVVHPWIEADRTAQDEIVVFAQEDRGRVDCLARVEEDVEELGEQLVEACSLEAGRGHAIERLQRAVAGDGISIDGRDEHLVDRLAENGGAGVAFRRYALLLPPSEDVAAKHAVLGDDFSEIDTLVHPRERVLPAHAGVDIRVVAMRQTIGRGADLKQQIRDVVDQRRTQHSPRVVHLLDLLLPAGEDVPLPGSEELGNVRSDGQVTTNHGQTPAKNRSSESAIFDQSTVLRSIKDPVPRRRRPEHIRAFTDEVSTGRD